MNKPVILVIDQGTSSTKAFIFNQTFHIKQTLKIRHRIHRPRPSWAESDAEEIVKACQTLLHSILHICEFESLTPVGLGIASQRSTFLFWDRKTLEPLTPAISWQDTRANKLLTEFEEHSQWIQHTTGTPLSSHFGGPKYLFTVKNDQELRKKVHEGDIIFGSLSSFITHALVGEPVVDESIAGRSLLMNLEQLQWDTRLLDLFEVPEICLPRIIPTCGQFGDFKFNSKSIPLFCVIGDQQASLIGQGRWKTGDVAMNFGTSGSVLVNSGRKATIIPSLLSNVLFSTEDEHYFILEGTINGVNSLFRWLEEYLDIPHEQMNWEKRCSKPTNGVMIPGLNGLAAPYWTVEFDTTFFGFPDDCHKNEYVRATMESIGFLVKDICDVIHREANIEFHNILVSGGASKPPLVQFIADLLNTSIYSSTEKDMTALGVAKLVGKHVWGSDITETNFGEKAIREFKPTMSEKERQQKMEQWKHALRKLKIYSST